MNDVVTLRQASDRSHARWPGALWVAEIQQEDLAASGQVILAGAQGYHHARLLVRSGRFVRGFVEVPFAEPGVSASGLDLARLRTAIAGLPALAAQPPRNADPAISVVLCTRHRPVELRTALQALLRLRYSNFEIVVVDNGPDDPRSAEVVDAIGDSRVRRVVAPTPGLSRARNVGIEVATHELIAFTDDDALVDPDWLAGIADGFSRAENIACVSGLVPAIELDTAAQWYFDHRVNWSSSCEQDVFHRSQRRPDDPLFPFQVGRYGTGANFAVRRSAMLALGGFDEAFGAGSLTGGGEDIDMFVRVLLAGYQLAYEPSALIWHWHRAEVADLSKQMSDYGTGLGAWLTKLVLNPRTLLQILRRIVPALFHLRALTRIEAQDEQARELSEQIGAVDRSGILAGPLALVRARRSGARARPLLKSPARVSAGESSSPSSGS